MQTDNPRRLRFSPFAYLIVAAILVLALASFAGGALITGAVIAQPESALPAALMGR